MHPKRLAHLLIRPPPPLIPSAQVDIIGTATSHTPVANASHDIKGIRLALHSVRNWPSGVLARRPGPRILRLAQASSDDDDDDAFSADSVAA